jgi:phage terminase large subunit
MDCPEVIVSGPAGTGKSRAILELIHRRCEQWPGCRWLIFRKTRESMTESVLVTFENHVVPPGHPCLEGASRRMRQAYHYPNGSTIVVGGMDKPSKIMSTEYDGAYPQESIELTENDWEMVTTRLRNGVMPYQQIIGDTNPDTPRHWIKLREAAGRLQMVESRHEDNPILWDGQTWTSAGAKYLAKLDALTGPRLQRLRYGRWVQAEGVVYEGWDRAVHLVDVFPNGLRIPPMQWARYLTIDFGFTAPFVCQWWTMDPDGRLWLYREIYRTKRLVEDHARQIKSILQTEQAQPVAILCDHDREDRATLERYLGQNTLPARKLISPGIQALAGRMVKAGDGKPRVYVLRDCLVERDQDLLEDKKPTCFAEEIDGYVWNLEGKRLKGEEPIDKDNHSMDAARYMAAHFLPEVSTTYLPPVKLPRRDLTPHGPAAGVDRQDDGLARRKMFGR